MAALRQPGQGSAGSRPAARVTPSLSGIGWAGGTILCLWASAPHEGDGPAAVTHKVTGRSASRKDQPAACPLGVRVVKGGI